MSDQPREVEGVLLVSADDQEAAAGQVAGLEAVDRFDLRPRPTQRIRDTYLDTADGDLGARRLRHHRPAAAGGGQPGHHRPAAGQEPGQAAPAHPGGPGRGQRPSVVAGRRPGGRDRPGRGRAGGGVRVP